MSFHMLFGNSFEGKKTILFFFSVYYALVSLLYLEFAMEKNHAQGHLWNTGVCAAKWKRGINTSVDWFFLTLAEKCVTMVFHWRSDFSLASSLELLTWHQNQSSLFMAWMLACILLRTRQWKYLSISLLCMLFDMLRCHSATRLLSDVFTSDEESQADKGEGRKQWAAKLPQIPQRLGISYEETDFVTFGKFMKVRRAFYAFFMSV